MKYGLPALFVLIVLAVLGWFGRHLLWRVEAPIRVGILHSKTGPLAISEQSMIDAELMAIEEINAAGGLLGRRSRRWSPTAGRTPRSFAQEARRLIETEKVGVIFGCWTSLCRRSVKSVVESTNHLLFFPSNYEGMDISSEHRLHGADPQPAGDPGGQLVLRDAQGPEVLPRRLAGRAVLFVERADQGPAQGDGGPGGRREVRGPRWERDARADRGDQGGQARRGAQHGGRRRQQAVLPAARPGRPAAGQAAGGLLHDRRGRAARPAGQGDDR